MSAKLRAAASHGMMAYLLSLGLTLTLLGVTGMLRHGWLAAGTLLALTGLTAAAGVNRRTALGAICLALFAGLVWLFIGGGGLLVEIFRALTLHMSGLATALPMVGVPFTVMICILTLAVSWFVTQRSAGGFPAMILLVMAAMLLWLGGWAEVLVCLLPAVLACVTLLLRAGDEHTSTRRLLPLAAAVTLIAFAGVWAGGAVSGPLKELADDIRQRIYDIFFYTQPRDVFTLATEGYYPQGLGQLGGPAEPREEPVMAVITPRKTYLRGVVKNVYTGRTWLDDIGGRRYLLSAGRFEELRTTTFDQALPMLDASMDPSLLSVQQVQVRMLRDSVSTLFVPQRMRQLQTEGDLIAYFNASSEIFATSNLETGDVWTVEAALFTSADSGLAALVNAADSASDPNWETVCATYLQLPDHLEAGVYELASQIVAGAQTPYDQALALQNYLGTHYAYNLEVPEQNPEQDFVSTFLLLEKQGYCTHFASAMTVLCRMVGLPARYVEGYVAYPDAEGLAVVTGKEGHAWTEVYFRGFGWVTFDATPVSVEYADAPQDDPPQEEENPEPEQSPEPSEQPTPTPEPSAAPEEEPSPSPSPETSPESESAPTEPPEEQSAPDAQEPPAATTSDAPWAGWLLLLLLLALALRTALVQPAVQEKRKNTEFGRWQVWTQAVHDALRRQGFVREASETPAAFLRRAASSGLLPESLLALADAENLMFYGHAEPLAEETRMARTCFAAVYTALKPGQKLIFQLQRIFLPARKFDITNK